MSKTKIMAFMMALSGLIGCETASNVGHEIAPNKERLDINEQEALALCKQIKEGTLHGSYRLGENNNGIYGDIAVSVYDEKNKILHNYAFKRNEKGWFDKVESVRPVVLEKEIPVTQQKTKWVPYQIPSRELTR